jgi:endonuclease I
LAAASRAERIRNDRIAALQGNRNPFVDRPEFADLLWYPV